jgi:hypothetical protein
MTVSAVLIGFWGENWRTCRTREREHAEQARQLEEQVNTHIRYATTYTGLYMARPELIKEQSQQALDHRSLEAAYRQAAWQPWKRWWIDESPRAAKNL